LSEKKIPLRMCTGCSQMKPKKELVRVVKDKEGAITLDLTGKLAGRGAYMCKSPDCLAKARKSKRLERTFKTAMAPELYEALEKEMNRC